MPDPQIRPSEELRAVVIRWVDAMNRRDYQSAANLFLRSEHFRYVGSDEHEWWLGTDPIDAYEEHQNEMPPYLIDVAEVEAFEMGPYGWAALSSATQFEGHPARTLRWTFVFVLDAGIWRIVQIHDSFAVPNPEVMGIEMTKSLEDLLAAVGKGVGEDLRGSVRQGTVTVLFTDIESSTELAARLGDEQWATIIEWHDRTLREIIEGFGGALVKTLGDGAMAAFESVRDAARSARAIQRAFRERTDRPELRVRIGIHVGDAVSTSGDYLGLAVTKAARIAAAAVGGEILASNAVRALLGDDGEFEFGDVHTVELKGLDGVHEIAELLQIADRS